MYLKIAILLALACIEKFQLSSSAFVNSGDDDWWKIDHYKVFATRGRPIEPNEVRLMLDRLARGYEGRTDRESITRGIRVNKLLEASYLSDNNCNMKYFTGLDKLIEQYSPFKVNVIPYLKHCGDLQFDECHEGFNRGLMKVVDELSDETKSHVTMLMDMAKTHANIAENSSREARFLLICHQDNLASSINSYLRALTIYSNNNLRVMGKEDRLSYYRSFESAIKIPCDEVERKMEFQLCVYDEKFHLTLDESGDYWLMIAIMCRVISKGIDYLAERVRAISLKQNNASPGVIKVIRWFGRQLSAPSRLKRKRKLSALDDSTRVQLGSEEGSCLWKRSKRTQSSPPFLSSFSSADEHV